ncbi:hypothetical protein ES702_02966 [subsurface metagenome]
MGGGKTLFVSLYARRWAYNHPNGKIFANYKLNLPNTTFTPYMFLGLTELRKSRNCLIVIDDFHAYKNMKQFSVIIANLSRKLGMEIVLTVQDWTMVPAIMRRLSTYKIVPSYSKNYDTLFLRFMVQNRAIQMPTLKFDRPVQKIVIPEKLYDTREIVGIPTERRVIPEILKYSKNIDDLDDNLFLFTANKQDRKRLFRKLCKKKGWSKEKHKEQQQNWYKFWILNKHFKTSFRKLSLKYGINKTKLFREINRIDYEIKEKDFDIIKVKERE